MRTKVSIISFLLWIIFYNNAYVAGEEYFAIISNRLIRPNKPYHVAIRYQGYKIAKKFQVGLKNSNFSDFKNVTFNGDGDKIIEFLVNDSSSGSCNLVVTSITGEAFSTSRPIEIVKKKFSVLIQTDKSIYKPADKVQFRVLILDADTRPFIASKVKIFITDGDDNRVKQFDDPKFVKGVHQNELQLLELPVTGKWKIHVEVDEEKAEKKEFEVAEYVLPKFEFSIDANPDANYKDRKIRVTVKAKYTFGKTAKGNATITASKEKLPGLYGSPKEVTKTVDIDGENVVEFDTKEDLEIWSSSEEFKVNLRATFTEELSGNTQNASKKVRVHKRPYEFKLKKNNDRFKPGFPYTITAILKPYDENQTPITDNKNPVRFTITSYKGFYEFCHKTIESQIQSNRPYELCYKEETSDEENTVFPKNGIANAEFVIPTDKTGVRIFAQYLDELTDIIKLHIVSEHKSPYLKTKLLTERPLANHSIKFEVEGSEVLKHYSYLVMGKGSVIESKSISVPNQKKSEFSFTATDEMAPSSHIIVYYISSEGEIISDKLQIELESDLKNSIEIQLSANQVKQSTDLDIRVKTKENSFVGLLGVDQSVLILKKDNDIEKSKVMDELKEFNKPTDSYDISQSYRDFKDSDAYIITNARSEELPFYDVSPNVFPFGLGQGNTGFEFDGSSESQSFNSGFQSPLFLSEPEVKPQSKQIEFRSDFPETWLFDSFNLNTTETTKILSVKAPDTITSWIITGFSVNPTYGLGLTRESSTLNVFQPFFVSTNLPYSIKRGEVVAIPFTVFNYMQSDKEVEVKFFNADREFEFVEVNEMQQKRKKYRIELERKKNIFVKSNEGATVKFMIRSLKVGYITIKVTAKSQVAGDGVEQKLLVVPEGDTQFMNEAVLVDLKKSSEFKTSIQIKVPNNAVEDSTRIEATISADLLEPSIENLDKLIKFPYGTGEQNMVNFVPNIVVLDYLTSVNKLTPEIEEKTKRFMESGYITELHYKYDDGSYSLYKINYESGWTWLTAFVIKSFNQASKYIEIETDVMNQGLEFLAKTQREDGSFPEVGKVISSSVQGVSSKGIGLTAYVLTTFLETHNDEKYKVVVNKGLKHILNNIEKLNDNYSLAIASYALQLSKDPLYDSIKKTLLDKLNSKSNNENQMKYWKQDSKETWFEVTSYGLLAFIEAGKIAESFSIAKWLVTQTNKNGGFQSTQETFVGLQALAKLASKISDNQNDIRININTDEKNLDVKVNSENSLVLQKFELPPNSRQFDITANGQGTCLLQIAYRYNINPEQRSKST